MKKWMGLAVVTTLLVAGAQAHEIPPGVYRVVPYNNNPDLFCKLGMPEHGWKAVDPRTGTWTPISQYPNTYWVPTYMYICPAGFRPAGASAPARDPAATF